MATNTGKRDKSKELKAYTNMLHELLKTTKINKKNGIT